MQNWPVKRKTASKNARNKQLRKTRVALANTRLKALRGYDYQPDNMVTLLEKSQECGRGMQGIFRICKLKQQIPDLPYRIIYVANESGI